MIDSRNLFFAVKQRPVSLPMPTSAFSSLSNIADTKPRSQTDPVQCTHGRQCQYPHVQHPYCEAVAEEEPLSSAAKIPSQLQLSTGSQCSAAATPVQAEIQDRQPRAEATQSSFSRSQTPSTPYRRYCNWPPYSSARSDMYGSTPMRKSRPSNISFDTELQEKLGRIGSTASSMVSLTTSSSDLEQWSGSTDEQEMLSFHQLHCKLYIAILIFFMF